MFIPRPCFAGLGNLGLAIGGFMMLAGGLIATHGPGEPPIPPWAVAMAGGAFFGPGLAMFLSGLAWRRRKGPAAGLLENDPRWDPSGAYDDVGAELLNLITIAGIVCGLIIPMTYALSPKHADGFIAWAVRIAVLALWGPVFVRAVRLLAYGRARIRFVSFPFFLGEEMTFSLDLPASVARSSLTLTLRCVTEGSSKDPQMRQVYSDRRTLPAGATLAASKFVTFQLPDKETAARLRGAEVAYWQLEVEAEGPASGYRTTFLLPVLSRPEKPPQA